MVARQRELGPDPQRVHGLAELAKELDLLRARAAAGTLKARVTLEDLTRLVRLPRSTLHRYITGRTLAPSEVLDRIVLALGASPAEQREWNEAWYRVHEHKPEAVPRGLPAAIRGFTGRATELTALDHLLSSASFDEGCSGLPILAVSGPPGVGKTALAIRWAHRVRDQFPDGCLYVDLRGYAPDRPMTPVEALGTLLGCLGDDVPPDPAVRGARYRSLLANRRMLVLLDNALCAEQVRPLLPGTGSCVVVVTSRDDLAGLVARDGAHRVALDVFPMSDGLVLLGALLGAERVRADPQAAATLVLRCGLMPLAIRVAAEIAAARPHAALTEIGHDHALDWLAAGGDPRTDVRAVFSWSYRHLATSAPDAAAIFHTLGRHSGILPLARAAALAGMTDDRAEQALNALVRAHLVHVSSGHYQIHDLLRLYASEVGRTAAPHPEALSPA
ncbi:DNA polymerase III delta prime subunit [Kibdelosporangium banguiense]|uniref:DNA polymerase III delta prime subunit n=1 Tax=Kibdelosporangium banguiense TaxID=1365924 RepID=A0ABS4TS31_9PSEU|nr:XRE family transcriptional regulator [Kibdelosporangium banguiense]MBP2327213.1 DNA polymerase III delta prime subunit [Kibdelosporangium banguiense]